MELDERIIEGKKPLTCFDIDEAEKYVGKKCYISNEYDFFRNLDFTKHKILNGVEDCEAPFHYDSGSQAEFCLPAEWVKEPEKKYRALTLNEFLERFKIGEALYIRFKRDKAERVVVFTEYSTPPHKDEGNDTESVCLTGIEHHNSVVCLGMREYYLATLYNCYEYFDGKEWQPFGVEEKE